MDAVLSEGRSPYCQELEDCSVPRQTVARWVRGFADQAPGHLLSSLPALGVNGAAGQVVADAGRMASGACPACGPGVAESALGDVASGGPGGGDAGAEMPSGAVAGPAVGLAVTGADHGVCPEAMACGPKAEVEGESVRVPAATGPSPGLAGRAWLEFLAWARVGAGGCGVGGLLAVLQPALGQLRPAAGVFRLPLNQACRGPPV